MAAGEGPREQFRIENRHCRHCGLPSQAALAWTPPPRLPPPACARTRVSSVTTTGSSGVTFWRRCCTTARCPPRPRRVRVCRTCTRVSRCKQLQSAPRAAGLQLADSLFTHPHRAAGRLSTGRGARQYHRAETPRARVEGHLRGAVLAAAAPGERGSVPASPPSTSRLCLTPGTRACLCVNAAGAAHGTGGAAPVVATDLLPLDNDLLLCDSPAQRCAELERSSQVAAESAGWLSQARPRVTGPPGGRGKRDMPACVISPVPAGPGAVPRTAAH